MNLKIGDKVKFLNETGEGLVTRIINKHSVGVTIEEGFELPCLVSNLICIAGSETKEEPKEKVVESPEIEPEQKMNIEEIDFSKFSFQKPTSSHALSKSKPHHLHSQVEIDLHIEELIDNFSGMTNAEIIIVQLNHLQKAINKAVDKKIKRLIIIHGIGNGRLKQEVRSVLAINNLPFFDASFARYGYGATEAVINP